MASEMHSIMPGTMLRTMITEGPFEQTWILHGRLCSRWAADLKELWQHSRNTRAGRQCTINLEDVTSVDQVGESALLEMVQEGARLVASRAYMKSILEALRASREESKLCG